MNIRCKKVMSKEGEITCIHQQCKKNVRIGRLYLPITVPLLVCDHVSQYVHIDKHTQNHLGDLKGGDDHVDPDGWTADSGSSDSVVAVHDEVDEVVERDEPLLGAGDGTVAVPAVDVHCHVVVPVQKYQPLLTKDHKVCVQQFGKF